MMNAVEELVTKYETEVRERSVKKNPQYYHALTNYRWAICLQAALNNEPLPEDAFNALCGVKSKNSGPAKNKFNFNPKPGDRVLDILNEARSRTNTPVEDRMHEEFEEALRQNKCHVEGMYVVSD